MTALRVPEFLTEPGYRDNWEPRGDLPILPGDQPVLNQPDPMEKALRAGRR